MTAADVLCLIPARGGSKSIPRKNLQVLAGHPLVAYSIATALASRTIARTIVSTDDTEIAAVSRRYGAETPFLRPEALAQDDTPDLPVFDHALQWLEEHERYRPDLIVHLRPTTPLRRANQVDRAVELLQAQPEADAVRAVASPLQNPFKMWTLGDDGFLRPLLTYPGEEPYNLPRQALPPVLWQSGIVDVTRRRTILEQRSMTGRRILPLVTESGDWIDIDTRASLELADLLLRSGRMPSPLVDLARSRLVPDVRLLVLDFDGVLTDNRVWLTEDGREAVAFDRGDGLGLEQVRRAGVDVLVLSKERNPVVSARCRKLGIPCEQGVDDKRVALQRWAEGRHVALAQVVYVGNDVNDLPCMEIVGTAVAVQDAHPQVLQRAHLVLSRPGGRGAVREICELIVASRDAAMAKGGVGDASRDPNRDPSCR